MLLGVLPVHSVRTVIRQRQKSQGVVKKMTAIFENMTAVAPADIPVKDLMTAYAALGKVWTELDIGQAEGKLMENQKMFQPCADKDLTVGQCLRDEAEPGSKGKTKVGHQVQKDGKPAVLKSGDSFALGLLWSCRYVGYMVEMFGEKAQGQSLKDAGAVAFKKWLAPYWKRGTWDIQDKATRVLVEKSLSLALPSGTSEQALIKKCGGESEAIADMKEVAEKVLPIQYCFLLEVRSLGLDDTNFPQDHHIPNDLNCQGEGTAD